MDFSLKQGLGVAVWIVVCGTLIFSFGTLLNNTGASADRYTVNEESFFKTDINDQIINASAPVLFVDEIHLSLNQSFEMNNLKMYATAHDEEDGDITDKIEVSGKINIHVAGTYQVKFTVQNSKGLKTAYIKNVLVD